MITLWTLCTPKNKWKSSYELRRSDSMGNSLDRIEKEKGSPLKYREYPDSIEETLRQFADEYCLSVFEISSYDNDDYPEYSYEDRESRYKEGIDIHNIVMHEDRPVGYMIEQTRYGGGMDSRTCTTGNIIYFDNPFSNKDDSYTISGGNSRSSWTRTYTVVKDSRK